jgi:hypothetical protein
MPIFQIVSRAFVYILVLLFCNGCFLRASIAELDGITSSQIPATENPSNDVISPTIEPDPNPPVNLKMSSAWNQPTSSPNLTWEYTTTGNSSTLSSYEVCLGTASNLCDILSWSNNTLLNQKKFSGLSLANNTDYYILVRAVDAAGNKSSVVSSRFKKVPSVIIDNGSSISGAWNVRVKKSNHNLACDGTETQFSDCINAGEMRSITYTGPSSCAGYTAADELGFFHWTCANGAGQITFKARWINEGKALKDLISGTSWRSNMVIIKQGSTEVAASTYQSWWENTIMELPDNATTTHITLNNANTVYVVSTSKEHGGFKIGADNVTVTTLGDAILTLNQINSTPNCNSNTSVCLIEINFSGTNKFAWIEGKYMGKGDAAAIKITEVIHSRIENIYISNFRYGIDLDPTGPSRGLIINKFNIANSTTSGIICNSFNGASSFLVSNGFISNVGGYAIYATDSCYNLIAIDNYLSSSNNGIAISSGSGSIINNRTDHVLAPLWIYALDQTWERSTIHHFIATNSNGISMSANAYLTLSNLMLLGSTTAITTSLNSNNNFRGKVILDSTTCSSIADTNPGINASCAYQAGGPSNATFIQINPNDWKNSFNGWVNTDDTKNTSDNLGFALKSTITDWFNFESIYRFWADNTSLLPLPDKNVCTNCQIWDSKIKSTDSIFKNTTGDGTNQNAAFIPGASCPAWLSGNDTVTDYRSSASTYLRNAKEIILDEIGDDDGLCETSESCIALPNWDNYQGSGDYYSQGECLFTNGTVSNIKVYMYPNQN